MTRNVKLTGKYSFTYSSRPINPDPPPPPCRPYRTYMYEVEVGIHTADRVCSWAALLRSHPLCRAAGAVMTAGTSLKCASCVTVDVERYR
jgi:hypothetical protein